MKRILVIDGGGAKGPIAATVLWNICLKLGREPHEIFDLIWGCSVGGIIGGILSSGRLKIEDFYPLFIKSIPKVFTPVLHIPFVGNKYSREPLDDLTNTYVGHEFLMSNCKTKFACTSVNMVDGKTHFFKSWEDKDGKMTVRDAFTRGYAAPYYFGSIKDPANNAVWLDGGTGNMSSPTVEAYVEACRQGWLKNEHVHILSLGCGTSPYSMPYKEAVTYRALRQIFYFMSPMDGGLARKQSDATNEEILRGIDANSKNFTFQRVEKYDLDPKMNIMDGVKYIEYYMKIGQQLSGTVDYTYLK